MFVSLVGVFFCCYLFLREEERIYEGYIFAFLINTLTLACMIHTHKLFGCIFFLRNYKFGGRPKDIFF